MEINHCTPGFYSKGDNPVDEIGDSAHNDGTLPRSRFRSASSLAIVTLETREYLAAIRRFAAHGITGGTVYDGLIAACALKAKADVLYTWNTGHFLLLGDEVARKLRTP